MELILNLATVLVLLLVGLTVGSWLEKRHFKSIRKREEELRFMVVVPSRNPPDINNRPYRTEFVCGSVVIAMDYFKLIAGSIIKLFGGRIKFYETLVERARREAVLRMKEEANLKKAQMVFNVKFSTAGIIKKKSGTPGGSVEVLAYGTAIIYQDELLR